MHARRMVCIFYQARGSAQLSRERRREGRREEGEDEIWRLGGRDRHKSPTGEYGDDGVTVSASREGRDSAEASWIRDM